MVGKGWGGGGQGVGGGIKGVVVVGVKRVRVVHQRGSGG